MDFVATPPHCAFCLCPLPPDESVTCRRCETPYCSAECRSNDLSEGCSKRWTEATVDEEADAPREDIVEAAALMRLCVEQRSQANGPDHPSTKSARHLEELVLHALERSERPAKRARRTLRLRDVDTREDPEHQEVLRIQRRVCATTRAEARNEERRRHFVVTASLEQLRRRMQRASARVVAQTRL